MFGNNKKNDPNRLGVGRLLLWKSSDISQAAVSSIVLGYLTLYCTDTLGISPTTVGTILLLSKLFDGVTDVFCGWLVDNTHTKLGRGRTYEPCIVGVCGCGAVCVESRPHPDFCGEKWWKDMDVILDEARSRRMKVWILDDSHFPTGFANGALKNAPDDLHRQSICASRAEYQGAARREETDVHGMFPPEFHPNQIEQYVLAALSGNAPHFEDDHIIAVTAVNRENGEQLLLDVPGQGETLVWDRPDGNWTLWVIGLSRNFGPHREYINMMDEESCRLLIRAVYEPHWEHYRSDFGKTIAGFFSDEPELGNGHIFNNEGKLGTDQDLPFSNTLPEELQKRLGKEWANQMYLLWDQESDAAETARVRYAYMDTVTKRVREAFSR